MQDTVSSRLKKISAEEFTAMERKASASKTGESTNVIIKIKFSIHTQKLLSFTSSLCIVQVLDTAL